jgi:RimJ/RimL family protein N-acetyltransferase
MPDVRLETFEPEQLPIVQPWFDDVDTQRWLGGPGWPSLVVELGNAPLGEFRGAIETGRHGWLAWNQRAPVGYIDCVTTDRWTTWEGGPHGRGVVATIHVPAANITYVVDPTVRRRGYGSMMVFELLAVPDLAHIELFAAGIEPDNVASIRCAHVAGFTPLDPTPDWEGIVYYIKRRHEEVSRSFGAFRP